MKREGIEQHIFGAPPLYDPLLAQQYPAIEPAMPPSVDEAIVIEAPVALPRLKPEVPPGETMTATQVQAMIDRACELAARLEAGTLSLEHIDPQVAHDWTEVVYNLANLDAEYMPPSEYHGPHRNGIY